MRRFAYLFIRPKNVGLKEIIGLKLNIQTDASFQIMPIMEISPYGKKS